MEGVIEANKAAVESCHRVLSLISQPKDQLESMNIALETGEAVCKFKRVISILNNERVGHARIRKSKKPPIPLPQSIFLDTPITKVDQTSKSLQFLQPSSDGIRFRDMGFDSKVSLSLGNSSLELSSNEGKHCQTFQQRALAQYHILQQQQQKVKQEPEMMYHRSNSGVSLTFDSSSCTPTMSSTRSFVSSLSVDGSVADMGGNSFHLFGGPGSSDKSSLQLKGKCSMREDGSVKYGSSSSRCHCSKKRKNKVKRSIKVPAISNKLADIPPDDYSWRKYGQKPIKGSPYPRGYYRCSCVKACSARKHVERCLEDPSMLIVTYEGEHTHPKLPLQNA